jgi:hypothetical protein
MSIASRSASSWKLSVSLCRQVRSFSMYT